MYKSFGATSIAGQRVNVPIEGEDDMEFDVVHILGRARPVCRERGVEVGDISKDRRPCLEVFARKDETR